MFTPKYRIGGAAVMLELLLLNLSCAPLVDTPERPPVMVMAVEACTVATLRALLVVNFDCFPLRALTILVPATVSVPLIVVAPVMLSVAFK